MGLHVGHEGRRGRVVEDGGGGFSGPGDPPEGHSMSCLGSLHAFEIDYCCEVKKITPVILGENSFI